MGDIRQRRPAKIVGAIISRRTRIRRAEISTGCDDGVELKTWKQYLGIEAVSGLEDARCCY